MYEDDVDAVYIQGGLVSYRDVLSGPFVYIPHDVVLPGVLAQGDLPLLSATLASQSLRIHCQNPVDGLNRTLPLKTARALHAPVPESMTFSNGAPNPASHLIR